MPMNTSLSDQLADKLSTILPQISLRILVGNRAVGSAVIVTPPANPNAYYILTAGHVFDDVDPIADGLQIQFFSDIDGKHYLYDFNQGADHYYRSSEADLAILLISRAALNPVIPFIIPEIIIALPEFNFRENCLFRGFPGIRENGEPTIIDANFLRLQNNGFFLVPNRSLESLTSAGEDNVGGLSGSGVCRINVNGQAELVGLFTHYQGGFVELECVDLRALNSLLTQHGQEPILLQTRQVTETDQYVRNDLERIYRESEFILNRIVDTIGQTHLHRATIQDNVKTAILNNNLVIITGSAGDGKSAAGKHAIATLMHEGFDVMTFRAESLVASSITNALASYHLSTDLATIIKSKALSANLIIFIDSAEKLLDQPHQEAFHDLLTLNRIKPGLKIVLTCRSYAYNEFMLEFYDSLPKPNDVVEIPGLSDVELSQIEQLFPALTGLLQHERLNHLLHKPFFVNLAVKHSLTSSSGSSQSLTEQDFKRRLWSQVIEKSSSDRGELFSEIALQRAKQMHLFTHVAGINEGVIQQLYQEGIIDRHPNKQNLVAPAHDIFEDLALVRFIDKYYQTTTSFEEFFRQIGDEPAIRRAYRLWLTDELVDLVTNYDLLSFLNQVIQSPLTSPFWKDETIIAILRSDQCSIYFRQNEEILAANNFDLFVYFLHLLRTACQDISLRRINELSEPLRPILFYHDQYLTPSGEGWAVCLDYIHSHFKALFYHHPLILSFVVNSWGKKIDPRYSLPAESTVGGEVLNWLLERYQNTYSDGHNSTIDHSIKLLLKLTEVVPTIVAHLLTEATKYVYTFDDLDESIQNYRLRNFYKQVLASALNYLHGRQPAYYLPEVVAESIRYTWLYRKEPFKNRQYGYREAFKQRYEIAEVYGFNGDREFKYQPASAYQTCIDHLFSGSFELSINLVVELANYSIDYCRAIDGNNLVECEINMLGFVSKQYGSSSLWAAYRGGRSVSGALESALMSLENWLLNAAQDNRLDQIRWVFEHLMRTSRSVATTAVLASVAIAYPDTVGPLAIPFLSLQEFLFWDRKRLTANIESIGLLDENLLAKLEREQANKLPHRWLALEYLALHLQRNGYYEEISAIIDSLAKTVDQDNKIIRLILKHMDSRNLKPDLDNVVQTIDGRLMVPMVPNYEPDLQEMLNSTKQDAADTTQVLSDSRWAKEVVRKEKKLNNALEDWYQKYHQHLDRSKLGSPNLYNHFFEPALLASIAIQDLWSQLDQSAQQWSINTLLNRFEERNKQDDSQPGGTIFLDEALTSLALALSLKGLTKEQRIRLKQLIAHEIFHSSARTQQEINFIHAVRQQVWQNDKLFGRSLIKGLLAYSDLVNTHKYRVTRNNYWYEVPFPMNGALERLTAGGVIQYNLTHVNFSQRGFDEVCRAISLLPYDTSDPIFVNLIRQALFYLTNHYSTLNHRDTSISPYDGVHLLLPFVANFLVNHPENFSLPFFTEFLEDAFDKRKKAQFNQLRDLDRYVEALLHEFIIVENQTHSGKIWPFWQQLANLIQTYKTTLGISELFLRTSWYENVRDWKPLAGKRQIIKQWVEKLGLQDFSSVVELLKGIGATELLPEGIIWLVNILDQTLVLIQYGLSVHSLFEDRKVFQNLEELIRYVYSNHRASVKSSSALKQSFMRLLDLMVNHGSSVAFVLRERIIAL